VPLSKSKKKERKATPKEFTRMRRYVKGSSITGSGRKYPWNK